MEQGPAPGSGPGGEPTATDPDLTALEALEAELASLEGELDRVDGGPGPVPPASAEPTPGHAAPTADDTPG